MCEDRSSHDQGDPDVDSCSRFELAKMLRRLGFRNDVLESGNRTRKILKLAEHRLKSLRLRLLLLEQRFEHFCLLLLMTGVDV